MNRLALTWHKALLERSAQGCLRKLRIREGGADFYSNGYLGFARDPDLQQRLLEAVQADKRCLTGATGSRLISGNSALIEHTEAFIAQEHRMESALLFSSGYQANLALFSSILGRHDVVLMDEQVHRSVYDGCLKSGAKRWKFRHNDLDQLEALLKKVDGAAVVALESLYSTAGDFAPLQAVVEIANRFGAGVIVDEAHAMGVFGKGLVDALDLQDKVLATMVTYGKAMGVQGAAVLGGQLLRDYLINFASPFIYSTGMPAVQVMGIRAAYEHMDSRPNLPLLLQERIRQFRSHALSRISQPKSPIQVIRFSDTDQLAEANNHLQIEGFQVYPLYAPTVRRGNECLRICLHAFNSSQEIDQLCTIIKRYHAG